MAYSSNDPTRRSINHDPREQRDLLERGTRRDLIGWLEWNDPNGDYSDADMEAEGLDPLTLEEAREIMRRQLLENAEPGEFSEADQ